MKDCFDITSVKITCVYEIFEISQFYLRCSLQVLKKWQQGSNISEGTNIL